jgi:predicted HAD superfamily Cof-like phosphohydrolase
MKELNALNQVAEFHTAFKSPILPSPIIPSAERCKLRIELLSEELKELQQAIDDDNIVEVADALCDLQYVLSGAVLEFGLGEKFEKLFNEVHRSNMSKACTSLEEAEATISHYSIKKGMGAAYEKVDDMYLIYRLCDNKTLKSINYSPADLFAILKTL